MERKKRPAWILVFALLLLTVLPAGVSLAAATKPAAEETTAEAQPAADTQEPAAAAAPALPAGTSQKDAALWAAGSGKSLCILLSDRATDSETAAANLLADWLTQATGEEPEILAVGTVDYLEKNGGNAGVSAYIILAVAGGDAKTGSYTAKLGADHNLYIEANDARACITACTPFCGSSAASTCIPRT